MQAREAAKRPENAPPNADQPFPVLGTVPSRPAGIDDRTARRNQVQSGLVADRNRARHVAINPGTASAPAGAAITGAPPAPAVSPPPPARPQLGPRVGAPPPVTSSNQAFQAAIAQQAAGNVTPRPPFQSVVPGPVRRNTIPVPPSTRGSPVLTPPAGVSGVRQLRIARPQAAWSGPFGPGPRSVSVGTVHFANGSAVIDGKYEKTLRSIVGMHKQRGGMIRVIGHASSRTRDTRPLAHQLANFRISVARAKAVAERLMRYGAPASAVAFSGVADRQRIYHEFMPLGEAGNRRAEIYLDY